MILLLEKKSYLFINNLPNLRSNFFSNPIFPFFGIRTDYFCRPYAEDKSYPEWQLPEPPRGNFWRRDKSFQSQRAKFGSQSAKFGSQRSKFGSQRSKFGSQRSKFGS